MSSSAIRPEALPLAALAEDPFHRTHTGYFFRDEIVRAWRTHQDDVTSERAMMLNSCNRVYFQVSGAQASSGSRLSQIR
jgi:hypothetical protein